MAGKPTLLEQALIQLGNEALAAELATNHLVELVCVMCGKSHWVPVAPLERLPPCCGPKARRRKASR